MVNNDRAIMNTVPLISYGHLHMEEVSLKRIDRIKCLHAFAKVADGKIVPPPIDPSLPELMKNQLMKKHQERVDVITTNGTNTAMELLNFVKNDESMIHDSIEDARQFIKDAKKRLKDIDAARIIGNATTNYIPLMILYSSPEELRRGGIVVELNKRKK